jgi:hypothetical protein
VISYRHHIVTLVAVFFALAVGVALGGGPLSDLGRDARPVSATVQQRVTVQRSAAYGDQFAQAVAPQLYADGLRGRSVAVVTLPGADGDLVSELGAQVEEAGGTVASTFELGSTLTDPGEKALVDTLGRKLAGQLSPGSVSSDASTYVRAGELVGAGVVTSGLPTSDASSVRATLAGGELMTSPQNAVRAPVVLVVLGRPTDPAILSGLVQGLTARATGVVVAGDTSSASPSGELGRLRSSSAADGAATVDGVDTPLGQVTAVLALERAFTVQGGSFGASGSDGPVPLK